MAILHGHQVLRLPPYHSGLLNPIEQVWGLIKNYIARQNKLQTLGAVSQNRHPITSMEQRDDQRKLNQQLRG